MFMHYLISSQGLRDESLLHSKAKTIPASQTKYPVHFRTKDFADPCKTIIVFKAGENTSLGEKHLLLGQYHVSKSIIYQVKIGFEEKVKAQMLFC